METNNKLLGGRLIMKKQMRLKFTETRADRKTYTATEVAKEVGIISPQKLNKLLYMAGFQYKVNGTWVPYAKFVKMGLVKIGEDSKGIYSREFTAKGREFVKGLILEIRGVI